MSLKRLAKKVLEINRNHLPEEWQEHMVFYGECAEYVAEARTALERAKLELEIVEAELDRSIRGQPEKYGLEKITEGGVDKTVKLQPSYKQAYLDLIEAKHEKDIQELMLQGLDHRKRALSDMVSLLIGNFYAEPKVKTEGSRDTERAKHQRTLTRE